MMLSSLWTVTDACTACGACLPTCPERCFRVAPSDHGAPLVVLDGCIGCGECTEVCPVEAARPLAEVVA